MKVRFIGGIREGDHKDPLMGAEIQPVIFPMTVPNYDATEASDPETSDPEELVIRDDSELEQWAEKSFEENGYEIFTLDIPIDSSGNPAANQQDRILALISAKKTEYEDAAPSTPEAEAERGAVVAALHTLEIHARDLVACGAAQKSATTA